LGLAHPNPPKFIGPTPEVIDGLGDKVSARTLALKCNVPVVPGTPGPVGDLETAQAFVNEYGYPVIIKAAFGGGGRGMRVVREGDSIQDAFVRATSEWVLSRHIYSDVEKDADIQAEPKRLLEMEPSS
jgi:pyruvate carboxylase